MTRPGCGSPRWTPPDPVGGAALATAVAGPFGAISTRWPARRWWRRLVAEGIARGGGGLARRRIGGGARPGAPQHRPGGALRGLAAGSGARQPTRDDEASQLAYLRATRRSLAERMIEGSTRGGSRPHRRGGGRWWRASGVGVLDRGARVLSPGSCSPRSSWPPRWPRPPPPLAPPPPRDGRPRPPVGQARRPPRLPRPRGGVTPPCCGPSSWTPSSTPSSRWTRRGPESLTAPGIDAAGAATLSFPLGRPGGVHCGSRTPRCSRTRRREQLARAARSRPPPRQGE